MASYEKYSLKDGSIRWRVLYRKPGGGQTTKRGFLRKKDAELWVAGNVTVATALGTFVDPSAGNATIGTLYENWFRMMKPTWKPSYRHTVEVAWHAHCLERWGMRKANTIVSGEVQQWVADLSGERSASTVAKAFGVLDAVLARAVKDRLIPRNPCDEVRLPPRPRRKERRVYLTMQQLKAFANECGHARELGDERRALVLTLGLCGLRWGEAAGLRVRDVDFGRRRLHVVSSTSRVEGEVIDTTPKSNQGRDAPMPKVVMDALEPIVKRRKAEDARVFTDGRGSPIRMQSASAGKENRTWWPSALRRLGWDKDDWPSPHDLRHTAASLAVHAGANVKALQRMLGHGSASLTLDVYADLFDNDLDDVAVALNAAYEAET